MPPHYNQNMFLSCDNYSLFSFYGEPSSGKLKGGPVHCFDTSRYNILSKYLPIKVVTKGYPDLQWDPACSSWRASGRPTFWSCARWSTSTTAHASSSPRPSCSRKPWWRRRRVTETQIGHWCGSVGRAVTSDTGDPWFESSHQQILFTINCFEKSGLCTVVYLMNSVPAFCSNHQISNPGKI